MGREETEAFMTKYAKAMADATVALESFIALLDELSKREDWARQAVDRLRAWLAARSPYSDEQLMWYAGHVVLMGIAPHRALQPLRQFPSLEEAEKHLASGPIYKLFPEFAEQYGYLDYMVL